MTELDGFERLAPALRAIATTRTDFAPASIQLMREPFNERRRIAAEQTPAQGVQIVENNVATESGEVPVRIYRGGKSPAPAVVYCHAGGFALGNLDTDHRQCVELARRGRCTVVSVDYRLAPEHPYPAALDDAFTAWSLVRSLRPDRPLFVAGDSAGGGLCLSLLLRLRDLGLSMPRGSVLLSPWTDLTISGKSIDALMCASSAINSSRIFLI